VIPFLLIATEGNGNGDASAAKSNPRYDIQFHLIPASRAQKGIEMEMQVATNVRARIKKNAVHPSRAGSDCN